LVSDIDQASVRIAYNANRVKILSDVDDTAWSSGGVFPAGCDAQFPRHRLYPGVTALYCALDVGRDDRDCLQRIAAQPATRRLGTAAFPVLWPREFPCNLAFLSARPHVYKDVAEHKSYARFKQLREQRDNGTRLHGSPTLLPGDVDSGVRFVAGYFEPMAQRKFFNFERFRRIFPEFRFVFVGDNGQGDVRAAELMMEQQQTLQKQQKQQKQQQLQHQLDVKEEKTAAVSMLPLVLIHQVQPVEQTPGYSAATSRTQWQRQNIVFFQSYVGAAHIAYAQRLISLGGLRHVCCSAVAEFNANCGADGSGVGVAWRPQREALLADLQALRADATVAFQQHFDDTTLVSKPHFGLKPIIIA
jgi:hypothetical protein